MQQQTELDYYRKKYKDEYRRNNEERYFRYERNGKRFKAKIPIVVQVIEKIESSLLLNPIKPIAFRKPIKGDYYLSGSTVKAYKALNDLNNEYVIVEILEKDV